MYFIKRIEENLYHTLFWQSLTDCSNLILQLLILISIAIQSFILVFYTSSSLKIKFAWYKLYSN